MAEGASFVSAADRLRGEDAERRRIVAKEMPFNVQFLDDALGGILPNDLVLLGARTGQGKTALASLIAQGNAANGKHVHYFALEAEPNEIERRIKYRSLVDAYYRDDRLSGRDRLCYRDWYRGRLDDLLGDFVDTVEKDLSARYRTLYTYYRGSAFSLTDLEQVFREIYKQTDLVILDHLQYVDPTDGANENQAYKQIVKRIRDISLIIGKPVLLIAHLRKRDRGQQTLIPDLDDFHGTSDITKMATKCILLSSGKPEDGRYMWPTFMNIPKDRMDGSSRNYIASMSFDLRRAGYEDRYALGREEGGKFAPLPVDKLPRWAVNAARPRSQ